LHYSPLSLKFECYIIRQNAALFSPLPEDAKIKEVEALLSLEQQQQQQDMVIVTREEDVMKVEKEEQ